jgi:hypothetical protein
LDTGTRFSFLSPSSGTWKCWTGGDAHPFIWPAMQVNNQKIGFECRQLLCYFNYFSTLLYSKLRCLLTNVETKMSIYATFLFIFRKIACENVQIVFSSRKQVAKTCEYGKMLPFPSEFSGKEEKKYVFFTSFAYKCAENIVREI